MTIATYKIDNCFTLQLQDMARLTPGQGQTQFLSDYSPTEFSDLQSLRGLFQEDSLTIILARMRCRGRQVDSLTIRSSLLMKCLPFSSSPAYLEGEEDDSFCNRL